MEESKMFYQKVLNTPIAAKEFDPLSIFTRYHSQDCCENVYVDIEHLDTYRNMIDAIGVITKIEFRTAPLDGFIIKIYNSQDNNYGIYFPCRNYQNGYYDDRINLSIDVEGQKYDCELQSMGCIGNYID